MAKLHKPGTDNLPAGDYEEVGPNGNYLPKGQTVYIDQGDRLPPTQRPGNRWIKK